MFCQGLVFCYNPLLMKIKNNKLHIGNFSAQGLIEEYGSPLYVYKEETLVRNYRELKNSIAYRPLKIHYALKANSNLEIVKVFRRLGAGVECVSPGEVLLVQKAGFPASEIVYTCSNIKEEELKWLIKNKLTINVDSLNQLEMYGKLNPNSEVSIRINQGIGAGSHKHVITGGPKSKFGIYYTKIEDIKKLAKKYKLKIKGLHQHIGSNILNEKIFLKAIRVLLKTAFKFEDLDYVDFGGGFGVPYKPKDKALNIKELGEEMTKLLIEFSDEYEKEVTFIFEPGRYLTAESGYLLATVVDIKKTPGHTFVGTDSGMNHLVRPAMYGAYHEILNASRVKGPKEAATIVGNICETGDFFARSRKITKARIGDVLVILNAGAYGYVMSSNYNLRPRPAEVLISKTGAKLIRPRQKEEEII